MQLRMEVLIDASPERVWAALTDFAAYPRWNPFIVAIEGELAVGSRLKVCFGSTDGRETNRRPVVLTLEPGHELRWLESLFIEGLFDGEHFFSLTRLDVQRTRLVHGGDFRGILLKYMGNTLTEIARGFVGMNQALKRHVEAGAR
jgi:hypothetical protein